MKHQAHYFTRPLAILLTSLALAPRVQAAGWQVVDTFTKSPGNQYGEATAVSRNGSTVAVTQALEPCTDGKLRCGAVYIYLRNQGHWLEQAKLFASDAIQNTQLGGYDYYDRTVTLSDDGSVLAVATNPNALGKGAVYVFVRNGTAWTQQQKLTLPTVLLPAAQTCTTDTFGRSLALSGDGKALIVGAGNECLAANTGAAYLFTKSGNQWTAQTRLVGSHVETAPTELRQSVFGASVDISGDGSTLLVGSPKFWVGTDLDQAYVFNKNAAGAWIETTMLTPADKSYGSFGFAVALNRSGNTALVGDYGAGAAYVYTKNSQHKRGWQQTAKLGANITQHSSAFGFSLDLDDSGTQALVGDWGSGSAFLFTRMGKVAWQPQQIIGGGNGSSVAISGDGTTLLNAGPGRAGILQHSSSH